ncbi:nitrate- and nitrite sensing domain-containing protein [Streptomyces sp. FIT100]|uniref:nitrate- and nitrite sensing domain-containing protein n=1 Tax=Streptomyces sp. FIT100 TaxID=2837956 RepID=UPI0021CAA4D8|nr:nitrate- and nitrite sensing domain-containing protein [Streptomyces sp. FIT100]UUN25711.1 nitrate- and nitrite sensing domain-containing protein [Streptomyces sp. FIT100]
MRFRGKSIRRKIVALLLVPLVSLTALWGFATALTGQEAKQLLDVGYIIGKVGHPIEDTVRVIQKERRQTLIYLADPRASDALTTLRRQRAATDVAVAEIRDSADDSGVRDSIRPDASQRLDSLVDALDGLGSLRRNVEKSAITRAQALEFYNRLVDPCYTFLTSLHALEDVELEKQGRALVGVSRARELLAREDALVTSALITRRITAAEIRAISDLAANRALLYETSLEVLPASEREILERYWRSPDTQPLREAEERLIAGGPTKYPRAIDAPWWQEQATPVLDDLARQSTEAGDRYQDRVEPAAYDVLVRAGVAGVLGFLALLVSVVVSVRIGRDLVRALSRLRKEAHEVSGVRLPSVMRRLAAGETVDVETEAPHLEYEKDEIGQVGQALNTLQRAAVEAAVRQADVRRGVSEVFVNLARRNQVLLHRQLTLLDAMERRTEDSEELADLFRLDHLTTRMRRHAEGLVILSGAAPSRQWRKPIQLMDVVRAAVAEVEDYERVEVRRLPRIGVGGAAVADLTHLIAELLENATVFSPPHTAVQVHGERVANGFTLEIHDRGLGMTPEALLDANLRLAETPEFELSDTDRLGLFVVSRLAQRQNVRISLQPSPYGGTTAVVFIPATLLTDAPDTEGTGFRLDRASDRKSGRIDRDGPPERGRDRRRSDGGRLAALSKVPTGLTSPSVLDGPVELEPPVGALGFDDRPALGGIDTIESIGVIDSAADIEDTESERGGLFRARDFLRTPSDEQHQQASDQVPQRPRGGGPRPTGPVPLPRRTPPTLVSDNGRRVDEAGRAHPAPNRAPSFGRTADAAGRTADAAETASSVGKAEEAPAKGTPGKEGGRVTNNGGLPRRVRQASLAPQLRADASAGRVASASTGGASADGPDIERDAEEVRARMAAMQRGWQRGRRHNAEDATGPDGTAGTAHGTTPEENGR